MVGLLEGEAMRIWENAETRPLPVTALGERYRRYRLADPSAEEAMVQSLQRYGQSSPVTAWRKGSGSRASAGAMAPFPDRRWAASTRKRAVSP